MSQRASMREHFENIKRWVGDAYYSSEAGMKELGWIGRSLLSKFPGISEFWQREAMIMAEKPLDS